MTTLRPLLVIFTLIFLSGCASQQGLNDQTGVTQTFQAPFEDVKAAARHSVETLNVKVDRVETPSPGVSNIWFKKSASAWSWGEVGLVKILNQDGDAVLVDVRSEKSYKLQVTGTKEEEFAEKIFDGIEQGLKDLEQ